MEYTIETLKAINGSYNYSHRMTESDVNKANMYVEIIENSRTDNKPQIGDIIEFTNKHGDYYQNAHIESFEQWIDGNWHICEQPYVPFISLTENKDNIVCSTSGGAWSNIPQSKMKLIGKRMKTFCDWGHCGGCANGAINFEAQVNVWEYKEDCKYGEYTTKDWSKHYISYCVDRFGNPRDGSRYRYFGQGIAFENKEDYEAWLKTYHGVEFKGNWENQTVVFCYKEHSHLINKSEWDKLELPIDTRLCNGVNPCKVEYDDDSHMVKTYRFDNAGVLDWRNFKEYEFARERYTQQHLQKEIDKVCGMDYVDENGRLEKAFRKYR